MTDTAAIDETAGADITPTGLRLHLLAAGFSPLPVRGKAPPMKGWQTKLQTNRDEIALWEKMWPDCASTGILTKFTPALDIDIMQPEAADAVEELARGHFEEHGDILVRFGRAPKRAIVLRSNEPFEKIVRIFTAPDGSEQKIEILANGQQVVVAGIHPDTQQPYRWHGGEPWTTPREELPYVREGDVRAFLDEAARVLVEDFGFKDKGATKQKEQGDGQDDDQQRDPADWGVLISRVLAGESLHDSIRDLAASFVGSGMTDKAAIERLRSLLAASTVEKDKRWRDRYAEIPRLVRTAREKFSDEEKAQDAEQGPDSQLRWHGEVDHRESRPQLVQDVIPEIGIGLVSGQWGTFKTFTVFDLTHCIMTGAPFLGFPIMRRGGVLFIALEGTDEIAIRLQGVIDHKGKLLERAPFAWKTTCPPLLDKGAADILCKIAEEAAAAMQEKFGLPLVMIVIDTLIAASGYSKEGQENDSAIGNTIMNTLKQVARKAGCFVFGVDHFGKDASTGTRGTSAKETAADVILALIGDKAISGEITNTRLALRKRRGGENGQEFPFKPRRVEMGLDARGAPMSTLIIDWGAVDETPTAAADSGWSKSLRLLRQTLMNMIADCGAEQRPYADGPIVRAVDIETVRGEFYKAYPADGDAKAKQAVRRQAFGRAVKDAQAKGLIGVREIGGTTFIWLASPGHGA